MTTTFQLPQTLTTLPAGYTDNPSQVDAFGLLDASINWETENFHRVFVRKEPDR